MHVLFFNSGGEVANFKDFMELKSIEKDRRFLQLVRKKMVMIKELLEIQWYYYHVVKWEEMLIIDGFSDSKGSPNLQGY